MVKSENSLSQNAGEGKKQLSAIFSKSKIST